MSKIFGVRKILTSKLLAKRNRKRQKFYWQIVIFWLKSIQYTYGGCVCNQNWCGINLSLWSTIEKKIPNFFRRSFDEKLAKTSRNSLFRHSPTSFIYFGTLLLATYWANGYHLIDETTKISSLDFFPNILAVLGRVWVKFSSKKIGNFLCFSTFVFVKARKRLTELIGWRWVENTTIHKKTPLFLFDEIVAENLPEEIKTSIFLEFFQQNWGLQKSLLISNTRELIARRQCQNTVCHMRFCKFVLAFFRWK